jgi:hypothetical protein
MSCGEFRFVAHNRKMKWGAMVGWGVVIYSIVSTVSAALLMYVYVPFGAIMAYIIGIAALVTTAIIAARSLHLHSWVDILPYSISWMLVVALCDVFLYSLPSGDWNIFYMWKTWVEYGLIIAVPLLIEEFEDMRSHTLTLPDTA